MNFESSELGLTDPYAQDTGSMGFEQGLDAVEEALLRAAGFDEEQQGEKDAGRDRASAMENVRSLVLSIMRDVLTLMEQEVRVDTRYQASETQNGRATAVSIMKDLLKEIELDVRILIFREVARVLMIFQNVGNDVLKVRFRRLSSTEDLQRSHR